MNHKPTLVLTKDTLKPSYEATIREIEETEARLEQLRELKLAMEKFFLLPAVSAGRVLEIPNQMIKSRARAPHGALKSAVLALFAPGQPLTNADVRERLVKHGYPHAIDNMNLRKTLDRLAENDELQAQHKDGRVSYLKPKR